MPSIMHGQGLEGFLPEQAGIWKPTGKDRFYQPGNLFDYINGGAELYLSYGFREVISRRYEAENQPAIVVEIFDMQEARNAYGIYSQTREQDDYTYGQGCQVLEGAILFWKGSFYVSVVAEFETPETREVLPLLAGKIDRAIKEKGALPGIVSLLPPEDLVEGSVLYFRHYVWANAYYYTGDGNIFGIEDDTEAVWARYGPRGARYYLLLMEFPSVTRAGQAFRNYWEERSGEPQPLLEEENGKWNVSRQEGRRVAFVFNAAGRKPAIQLIKRVF